MSGKVYLIGAGCGDKGLITLKGLEALKSADAVVYDDLIDKALLDEAEGKEVIYMGKRNGRHSALQEEISAELVRLAEEGKTVARLKGGDPFVFGRGGEEALSLIENGIEFEEVPGISSSIAIPAQAGIPVTHRGISRGFMVVTGHTKDGAALPEDIDAMASFKGTVVILMGLTRLKEIASALIERGKSKDTPAAVISGGNSPNPKTARGTLETIYENTRKEGVVTPAVIVIGETASMNLVSSVKKPLEGVRVGVTGTTVFRKKLRQAFLDCGASVSEVLSTKAVAGAFNASGIVDGEKKCLVFTSANGVRIFFSKVKEEGIDMRRFGSVKFAVIGRPTGKVLESFGFSADICPEVFESEKLGRALIESLGKDTPIVLLRAENASGILPGMLEGAGFRVRDERIYSVVPLGGDEDASGLDYITFSSAGGVDAWKETKGELDSSITYVAIGNMTAGRLEKEKVRYITAKTAETGSIVQAVIGNRKGK